MSGVLDLTQRVLKHIFPAGNYEKVRQEEKPMVLHFLIANKQSNPTITVWIEKHPEWINHRQLKYLNLTPLAVCVLSGNGSIAEILLNNRADITLGDCKDWTPLHHAAVIANQMLTVLLGKIDTIVAAKLLTDIGGTYEDLRMLIDGQLVAHDEQEVFYLRDAGKVGKFTAQKFREITHANFCHSVVVTPEELMKSWIKPKEMLRYPLDADFVLNEYKRCLENPPRISLCKSEEGALEGFDVIAEENISAFQGIVIYGGLLNSNPTNITYLLSDVDASETRNLGAMINDGFPNCMVLPAFTKGFRYIVVFAIRNINQGERLLWNYGSNHSVKMYGCPHLELNTDELFQYADHFLLNDITVLVSSNINNIKNHTKKLKFLGRKERLKYIVETPSTLIYLISQNHFPSASFKLLLEKNGPVLTNLEISDQQKEIFLQFASMCYNLDIALNRKGLEGVSPEIRQLLFHMCTSKPMSVIINCFDFFVNTLRKKVHSSDEWHEFNKDWLDYLSFVEALYYFCSPMPLVNHSSFLPKVIESFSKLGKQKKIEGFSLLRRYTTNLDEDRKRVLYAAIGM